MLAPGPPVDALAFIPPDSVLLVCGRLPCEATSVAVLNVAGPSRFRSLGRPAGEQAQRHIELTQLIRK